MKLTVLVDNNTYINEYYFGEPALSIYIENASDKILFDTGYSDVFKRNADLMNINLDLINKIIFSHGHNDHTGGLGYMNHKVDIIAHPYIFKRRTDDKEEYGSFLKEEEVFEKYHFLPTTKPIEVSKNLYFLGEIPHSNSFEQNVHFGKIFLEEGEVDDYTVDDSALVYKGKNGLHIITGCSHSGICNIIEYAKKVLNEERIISVLGGFHLFECDSQLDETIEYFKRNHIQHLYPCHCTSFQVKAAIHNEIKINEVGVGMSLDLE